MKVQSISNDNTFKAKCLPKDLQGNISLLKKRIDADAVVLQTKDSRQIIRIRSLDVDGEAKIKDGRFLARRDKHKNLVPYGSDTIMIEFGKVKIISDSNGNIIFHKKPLFTKWAEVFEKAGQYVQSALENYKNPQRVIKHEHKQENLTDEGKNKLQEEYKRIMHIFNKINPFKE